MKFFAATLLAIGAAAIKVKQDGTEGPPPQYGGYGGYYGGDDFPFPPPECGEGPTAEEFDNATDE